MTVYTISGHCPNYFIPLEEEPPLLVQDIERWRIGDKEICLQRKEEKLCYEVLDTTSDKTTRGPIDFKGHSIEDAISFLIECQPEILETGKVIFSPRKPLPYIQRWIIGDHEIRLLRKETQLIYEVLNYISGAITTGSIKSDGFTIDDIISYLIKCQPEVLENGGVNFCPKPPAVRTWLFRNKVVEILQKNQELIWQLFDKSTKTLSQAPFNFAALRWDSGDRFRVRKSNLFSVDDFLSVSSEQTPKFCLSIFKDCDIEKLKIKSTPSLTYRLDQIFAREIVGRSKLDPSVPIDRGHWAITLINSGVSDVSDPFTWGGHAAIIIEGRKKGAFINYKAHLINVKGNAVVSLQQKEDEEFYYTQKGETWRVDSKDVKRMLKAISYESERQEQWLMQEHDKKKPKNDSSKIKNPTVFFDLYGSDSKLVKPIVIKEYDSYHDLIQDTLPECLDSSIASSPVPYKKILLIYRSGERKIVDNRQFEIEGVKLVPPQRVFIQNKSNDKWREVRLPDNCLTWAAEKLKSCGIHLTNTLLKSIYALPKAYMTKGLALKDNSPSRLLRKRINLTEESDGSTSLMCAIKNGDIDEIEAILASGVDLNARNSKGYNALHVACELGDTRTVNLLYKKGMNLNEPVEDLFRKTPLFLAIKNRHECLVELLLKLGVKVNQKDAKTGDTILHLISKSIYIDRVTAEICQKNNVNIQNNDGQTPLMLAAAGRKIKMVRHLLQNGASIDQKDKLGRNALWYAYDDDGEKIAQLLIEHGASVEEPFDRKELPILAAVSQKKVEMARLFLKYKASANQKDADGCTVLWRAYVNDDVEMLQLLIKHGANLGEVFDTRDTPLVAAIRDKKVEMARLFLQNKAFLDQKDQVDNELFRNIYYNIDEKMLHLLSELAPPLLSVRDGCGDTLLIRAVKDQDLENARLFLESKVPMDAKDDQGRTALWHACDDEDEKIVRLLIENGIDLLTEYERYKNKDEFDSVNPFELLHRNKKIRKIIERALEEQKLKRDMVNSYEIKATLQIKSLRRAIQNGNINKVKKLLAQGVDLKAKNKNGYNALHQACHLGNFRIVKLLLEHGMDLNEPSEDFFRSTLLHLAISGAHEFIIELLLKLGANINQKNAETGDTLLHHTHLLSPRLLEVLIKLGANVNSKNELKGTPLMNAVHAGKRKIARQLLQNQAAIDEEYMDGGTALLCACRSGDRKMVRLLINYGADLLAASRKDKEQNPFEVLDQNENSKKITSLLKKALAKQQVQKKSRSRKRKKNISFQNKDPITDCKAILNITPLMRAIEVRSVKKVKKLLAEGVDLKAKNLFGHHALHVACLEGDLQIIKILLEQGMDINEPSEDIYRSTPLLIALRCFDEDLLEFLIESGVDLNQKDSKTGDSVLHVFTGFFFQKKLEKILEILIKHGANINIKNNQGETPLIKAVREKKILIPSPLLENKAALEEEDNEGRTALWHACRNNDLFTVHCLIRKGVNLLAASLKVGSSTNPFELARLKEFKEIENIMNTALEEQKAKMSSQERKPYCILS